MRLIAASVLTMVVLGLPADLRAQEVFFDVTPLIGTPLNTTPGVITGPVLTPNVLVVAPGAVVPYALGVTVQPTPALPNVNGLAGFNVDVLTTLGRPQPPLTRFDPLILQSFVSFPSLGFPVDDDVLDIAARQELTGIVDSGVGVGRRQVIATGELFAPDSEGDFEVAAVGTAEILVTGINPFTPVLAPASVGSTAGFIIQTRADAADGDADEDQDRPPDEGDISTGTSLVNLCFPGAAPALLACMAGLVGMRRSFRRVDPWKTERAA